MEYEHVDIDSVEKMDLSKIEAVPPDLTMRAIGEHLGTREMAVKVWYFEPGEEIPYHAHEDQEELFYVIDGTFSVKAGRSGETEIFEATPGDFWAAAQMIGHGHRYTGDDTGVILAIGAGGGLGEPGSQNPHELTDREIDEALGE